MSTTLDPQRDGPVIAERPTPGAPRGYEFPAVASHRLSNGLSLQIANLPGRPLVSATMTVVGGAAEEPADEAGATVLAARALTEGTERHDAIALVDWRRPSNSSPRSCSDRRFPDPRSSGFGMSA